MALILSGDTGVPASGMPTGSVIQTVQGTQSTYVNTTTGGALALGLTASITPTSATSKILILISQNYNLYYSGGANLYGYFILNRGGTAIYTAGTAEIQLNSGTQVGGRYAINYLDSPATTSSTTYSLSYYNQSGSAQFNNSAGTTSYITLMEIKQ